MILFPAIDIYEGKAVRLVQGDFEAKTVYDEDPLDAARHWVAEGAQYLHVVDLDGAKTGSPQNLDQIRRIASELGVPVQIGGGLRSAESVAAAFAAGAERVILGTAAFADDTFLDDVLADYGDQVMVSVDTRGGMVSTAGWTHTTDLPTLAVIEQLQDRGVSHLVYTNVDRDGMQSGADVNEVRQVAGAVRGTLIYSGGIGTVEDLRALAALRQKSFAGVISGKALYEKAFTVAEGQAALRGHNPEEVSS